MKGGAQAHLLRCDDGGYYIVKFQNNPQHLRILANEMLATRLAALLGLCVPQVEVVEVCPELISSTPGLVIQFGRGQTPCSAGKQFGSRYPGIFGRTMVHEFIPAEKLYRLRNFSHFLGVYVFDKWTCNTDRRQAIFFLEPELPDSDFDESSDRGNFQAMMIDQGACFNAGEWNFPDAPLRGIYEDKHAYDTVLGLDAFGPWIDRLQKCFTKDLLRSEAQRIPSEWYAQDKAEMGRLLDRLYDRRSRVCELIELAHKSSRNPFPNWALPFNSVHDPERRTLSCGNEKSNLKVNESVAAPGN